MENGLGSIVLGIVLGLGKNSPEEPTCPYPGGEILTTQAVFGAPEAQSVRGTPVMRLFEGAGLFLALAMGAGDTSAPAFCGFGQFRSSFSIEETLFVGFFWERPVWCFLEGALLELV